MKMKKIFSIISAVIVVCVAVLVGVMAGVKKNIGVSLNKPEFINVYYKSTTTKNNGQSYREYIEDSEGNKSKSESYDEYNQIYDLMQKLTNLSLIQLAQNNSDLNYKVEYNKEHYASYDSRMKENNLVIEFIYKDNTQNALVYDGSNARVIPYYLLFVIPINTHFEEIVVYTSTTNASNQKEEQYENCVPFILKGIPKDLISYVETLE